MYNCSNGPIYICNCRHLFLNLLYYCEVRYQISNQGNPSFINLAIQRRFTENVLKRNKKKFVFGFRTIGPSDYYYWTFGLLLLDLRTIEPSDYWNIGPSPLYGTLHK